MIHSAPQKPQTGKKHSIAKECGTLRQKHIHDNVDKADVITDQVCRSLIIFRENILKEISLIICPVQKVKESKSPVIKE